MFKSFFPSSSANDSNSSIEPEKAADYGPITHEPLLTPPAKYEPTENSPLDDNQKQKLKELMAWMDTFILEKEDPYYNNERGFLSEATANRYMRARKWDFEAAKKMLQSTIEWRRGYKPDMVDAKEVRPEAETGKMYFSGYDKTGKPLWIMKPRYENSNNSERQIQYIVFCLERGIRLMPDSVEKISIVVDFKDSTSSNNPSIGTCKTFLTILSSHYPERLGTAFLVNTPWFFILTFKAISPFIDPITREKVKFINKEDSKSKNNNKTANAAEISMEDRIDLDQMEVELGGKYNFGFDIDTYWERLLEKTGNPYKEIEYK